MEMTKLMRKTRLLLLGRGHAPQRRALLILVVMVGSLAFLSSHGTVIRGLAQDTQTEPTLTPPYLDGVISPGEYAVANLKNVTNTDNFHIYVSVIKPFIYIGMVGRTDGWISVGIEPESDTSMKGADIILGWVSGNRTYIVDAYAHDVYDHKDDREFEGGSFDIVAWHGTEANGVTTIEFVRLLNTTDTDYDKAIAEDADQLSIIWAIGPSSADNNADAHDSDDQSRGRTLITLRPGVTIIQPTQETTKISGGNFLLFHSVIGFLLGIAFYAFIYFPTVAIFVRRDLQEIVAKRKLREYPRVVEKPRVKEPSDSSSA